MRAVWGGWAGSGVVVRAVAPAEGKAAGWAPFWVGMAARATGSAVAGGRAGGGAGVSCRDGVNAQHVCVFVGTVGTV